MRVADYNHNCRQLRKMMGDAASWCATGCERRERPAEYFVEASEREERDHKLKRSDAPRSNVSYRRRSSRTKRS